MAGKGGFNGLSVRVANTIFIGFNIVIEDKKAEEGSYIATNQKGETIRKAKVTDIARAILEQWFILK